MGAFPSPLIVYSLEAKWKWGVPSYFIIIFIVYSFKCSALSSYSPTAGRAAEPRRGQWKEAVKGGRGAQENTLCFAEGWPSAFCSTGQQGARWCYLWTRHPSRSELRDRLGSFTQLQKEGAGGMVAPKTLSSYSTWVIYPPFETCLRLTLPTHPACSAHPFPSTSSHLHLCSPCIISLPSLGTYINTTY